MDSAFFDEWIYIYQPFPCASALKLCATPTLYLTKSHVRCFDNIICRTSENSLVQHRPMSWWSWIRVVAPVVSVKNTRYKFSKKNILVQVGCFTYMKKGIKYYNFTTYLLLILILFLWLHEILCMLSVLCTHQHILVLHIYTSRMCLL